MCACTEPGGTGISAVCVERGGQTWPDIMLNHARTYRETKTKAPYSRTVRHEKGVFSSENQAQKRLALPYNTAVETTNFTSIPQLNRPSRMYVRKHT